jgi:hypothetical protein
VTPFFTALASAACVFAGGMVGLQLHRVLPDAHLTKETQDVVRLGTGMLSVLASLVLGLLISTAKTTYDTTDRSMRAFAADLILLDETLRDYGDDARIPRGLLRDYTLRAREDHWPSAADKAVDIDNDRTGRVLERVREQIRALKPVDGGQTWLMGEALKINSSLLQQRWLLIEQEGPTVRPLVLGILVSWIFFIFTSFGLNAPRHATVLAAFAVCSLAIGCAVFLIMELDDPFAGALRVSSQPMDNALAHMKAVPQTVRP